MKAISQELACALAHAAAVGDGYLPPVEGLTLFVDRHAEPMRSQLAPVPDVVELGVDPARVYPVGFEPVSTQAVPVQWARIDGGAPVLAVDFQRVFEQMATAPRLPLTDDTRTDVAGLAELFLTVAFAVRDLGGDIPSATVGGLADAVGWLVRHVKVLDAMVSRGER